MLNQLASRQLQDHVATRVQTQALHSGETQTDRSWVVPGGNLEIVLEPAGIAVQAQINTRPHLAGANGSVLRDAGDGLAAVVVIADSREEVFACKRRGSRVLELNT